MCSAVQCMGMGHGEIAYSSHCEHERMRVRIQLCKSTSKVLNVESGKLTDLDKRQGDLGVPLLWRLWILRHAFLSSLYYQMLCVLMCGVCSTERCIP